MPWVALVCDDKLFMKPTAAGRKFIGDVVEGCPYPGAKPYFLISGNKWDDRAWLVNLIQISAAELPLPKKKAPPRDVAKSLGVSVRTLYRWITAAAHSQTIFKAIKNFEGSGLQPQILRRPLPIVIFPRENHIGKSSIYYFSIQGTAYGLPPRASDTDSMVF